MKKLVDKKTDLKDNDTERTFTTEGKIKNDIKYAI